MILRDLEERLEGLRSVLVFACSVAHAETMAEVLSRRGQRALDPHGGTPRSVRQNAIARFRDRSLKVLVTCDLLTTGFDAPNVDAVLLARPVESRVLFAQMVGRGLRGPKNGGTERCLILDYEDAVGDYRNLDRLRLEFRESFLESVAADGSGGRCSARAGARPLISVAEGPSSPGASATCSTRTEPLRPHRRTPAR